MQIPLFLVPPTLWITHQQVHAETGSTVKLDCLTAAHPPSINYWSRDGKNYLMPNQNELEKLTLDL